MAHYRIWNNSPTAFNAGHPFVSSSPVSKDGWWVGRGIPIPRREYLNLRALMYDKDVNSALIGVLGDKDAGKSVFLKVGSARSYALQSMDADMNPVVTSLMSNGRKVENGESDYKPWADSMDGVTYSPLDPDAEKLNIFGLGMGVDDVDNIEIAHNVAEQLKGDNPLTSGEAYALRVAMFHMLRMSEQAKESPNPELLRRLLFTQTGKQARQYERQADKKQFEEKFLNNPLLRYQLRYDLAPSQNAQDNLDEEEFRADSMEMYRLFDKLLSPPYSRVFGGNGSLVTTFKNRVLNFDWTGMDPRVRDLLEGVIWKVRTIAMEGKRLDLYPRILISDEESEAVRSTLYLRFMLECVKKARMHAMMVWWATQAIQDIVFAGNAGHESRNLAQGIANGTPAWVIFHHDDNPYNQEGLSMLGVPERDQKMIFRLFTGQFALWIPKLKRCRFMQLHVTPDMLPLIVSNSANEEQLRRVSNRDNLEVMDRIRRHGTIPVPPTDPGAKALAAQGY